ncbi:MULTISPECIES: SRPBCC family protein [unclassified Streptomyces]|uniref:SRPBCC family protein n=1 Tax=unclassified Streptomyces TaxID=2593676 RepID=UPI002F90D39E
MFEAINWPEAVAPSRSPIHFTNELDVEASPETIWSLLVDPQTWPTFYPGVEHVQLLDGHESLHLGTRFETNLAGQDAFASVQEFQPVTRIAWGGYQGVGSIQGLPRLDHHAHAEGEPPLDRGDDAGPALDRIGEAGS